jgi:hypothetical protein
VERKTDIRDEQTIKQLLQKMPDEVNNSFSEQQLTHIFTALGTKNWANHSVDLRGAFKIPFIPKRYYYVVLFGQNRRDVSRYEAKLSTLAMASVLGLGVMFCILLGLLVLYLIKSALGIDLFANFSLGIWSWFKSVIV